MGGSKVRNKTKKQYTPAVEMKRASGSAWKRKSGQCVISLLEEKTEPDEDLDGFRSLRPHIKEMKCYTDKSL